MVDVLLTYDEGLSRYYGLLELAEEAGIFKKVAGRFEMANGTKLYGKQILNDPEKYFTEDIMKNIDSFCQTKFLYGKGSDAESSTEELVEEEVKE